MTRPKLLIVEPENYSAVALELLGEVFELSLGPLSRVELLERVGAHEGLVVRLAHRLDDELLGRASRLRFIASPTTGLDHIDLDAAARRGIRILSLRGERAFLEEIHATAEHSWALLLALLRRIPAAHNAVIAGGWERDPFRGGELHGRTLGIIGYGRLGSKVAAYGRAFGMRVVASDPVAAFPDWIETGTLDEVAAAADVLSIHVSSGPETRGLIGERVLARMKPGSLLVNTTRGDVVDESALLSRLRDGSLGGAALDVLAREYDAPGGWETAAALRDYAASHDNLILTPHIGGATWESMEKTEVFIARRILESRPWR